LKPIPETPGMRTMCPDNCRYRDRLAPFCGYCMLEILGRKQDTEEKDGEIDTEIAGQAREKGL
jgi:hypothetical protein